MGTSFGFLPSGAQPDVRRVDGNARASATSVRILTRRRGRACRTEAAAALWRGLLAPDRMRSFAVAPWRELLRVYRPPQSRGEIRGGRFAAGFSGEQFAPPDAVGLLRETRRRGYIGNWIAVSDTDPLNLAGVLTPGPKIAALAGNRVLYRDGVPVASLVAHEITFFEGFDFAAQWQVRQALLRGAEYAASLVQN